MADVDVCTVSISDVLTGTEYDKEVSQSVIGTPSSRLDDSVAFAVSTLSSLFDAGGEVTAADTIWVPGDVDTCGVSDVTADTSGAVGF